MRVALGLSRRVRRLVSRSADAQGSVTAEFAVALPAIVAVLVCCVGAVQVASQQIRLADAAADAARSVARGDPAAVTAGRVRAVAGEASVSTTTQGEFVCVSVAADAAFPAAAALGLVVRSSSCALAGGL